MQVEMKPYSTEELKTALNVQRWVWETRREEFLEYLGNFFDYEIKKDGRKTFYVLKKQLGEYVPMPRQGRTKEVKEHYYNETKNEVKRNPWNTGSNIARNIYKDERRNKYKHEVGTITNYVRPIIKERFMSNTTEMQWMHQVGTEYVALTEEQLAYLVSIFDGSQSKKEDLEAMSQYKAGYLTREEVCNIFFENTDRAYMALMSKFQQKYGFMPIKVKHLEENAF